LAASEAVMILSAPSVTTACTAASASEPTAQPGARPPTAHAAELARIEEQRRSALGSRLQRSADAYVVTRNEGRTILAGFPWFTD
ncbi:hypothetical protein SB777_36915, partial [Burkholderia sp. SIMBA_052]